MYREWMNYLAFDANTIIVRSLSGECKNDSAYGTVLLADAEGRNAMKSLKQFLGNATDSDALVFRSKRGGSPETTLPSQCLHPARRALGLPRSGFHAFRRNATGDENLLAQIPLSIVR